MHTYNTYTSTYQVTGGFAMTILAMVQLQSPQSPRLSNTYILYFRDTCPLSNIYLSPYLLAFVKTLPLAFMPHNFQDFHTSAHISQTFPYLICELFIFLSPCLSFFLFLPLEMLKWDNHIYWNRFSFHMQSLFKKSKYLDQNLFFYTQLIVGIKILKYECIKLVMIFLSISVYLPKLPTTVKASKSKHRKSLLNQHSLHHQYSTSYRVLTPLVHSKYFRYLLFIHLSPIAIQAISLQHYKMSSPVSWSPPKGLFSTYSTDCKKDVISLCRIDEDLVVDRNLRGSDTDRNHWTNAETRWSDKKCRSI